MNAGRNAVRDGLLQTGEMGAVWIGALRHREDLARLDKHWQRFFKHTLAHEFSEADKARQEAESVAATPLAFARLRTWRAMLDVEQGQPDAALLHLLAAHQHVPSEGLFPLLTADLRWRYLGDATSSTADAELAARLSSGARDVVFHYAHQLLGLLALQAGDPARAAEHLVQAGDLRCDAKQFVAPAGRRLFVELLKLPAQQDKVAAYVEALHGCALFPSALLVFFDKELAHRHKA